MLSLSCSRTIALQQEESWIYKLMSQIPGADTFLDGYIVHPCPRGVIEIVTDQQHGVNIQGVNLGPSNGC